MTVIDKARPRCCPAMPPADITASSVDVTVLGFREHASWALASDSLESVDLEEIPGVFREPLPRIGLDSLSSLLTARL